MTSTATITESYSATSLDFKTLLELARRTDPVGVLSIYLNARPGAGLRAASIDVKNRLAELQQRILSGPSVAKGRSVQEGLGRLAGEIESLTAPEEPGRGRVLLRTRRRPAAWEQPRRDHRLGSGACKEYGPVA